jgi:hypothetical protein
MFFGDRFHKRWPQREITPKIGSEERHVGVLETPQQLLLAEEAVFPRAYIGNKHFPAANGKTWIYASGRVAPDLQRRCMHREAVLHANVTIPTLEDRLTYLRSRGKDTSYVQEEIAQARKNLASLNCELRSDYTVRQTDTYSTTSVS